MNIQIVCVGKLKEVYWTKAIAEYSKRLSKYCNLSIDEVKEEREKEAEGKHILRKLKAGVIVIALDIRGKDFSSEELAEEIEQFGLEGKNEVIFIIGGSLGLSQEVLDRSDMRLSFSKMTFPHQMMRVILLEQIYRSFKIIKGEPYHK
ncbi:MAG: 23S rRNA (pseudouridine(1915)-N(3))-methyltransferase RlmH [Eubacteriales bacterium]|nr:23S rRNA (pseudouridine(1915)-N(3))-methyltransferase RlmH [Eubacteriales bacterium]MDD4583439.1 23S rRNA (pseudouridine(1915)-N(3))-methyltransferase RlmH [Eubacteriales bacterium]